MKEDKYLVDTTKGVERKLIKLIKRDRKLDLKFRKAFKQLKKDPFYGSLKTHKVKSSTFGFVYSSRVTGDLRILWYLNNKRLYILIVDIGGHEGSKNFYK